MLSEWSAASAVHVYPVRFFAWGLSARYRGPRFPMLDLLIDGAGGTLIVRFDGRPESLKHYRYLEYDLSALGQVLAKKDGSELIIGPGGGVDILQAVRYGRTEVTAVEINPLVARVVNVDLARFSGRPYHLPGVKVHIDNGRTFIKRSRKKWDFIVLNWVDTGGSATALAFADNYLYTIEAYGEFFDRLEKDGVFGFLRSLGGDMIPVDTLRGIAVTIEALDRRGIKDYGKHLLIAGSRSPFFGQPMCYVAVKMSPFTQTDINRATTLIDKLGFDFLWLPDGSLPVEGVLKQFQPAARVIRQIIESKNRPEFYRTSRVDITPTTDDNPFYFVERAGVNREAGIGVKNVTVYLWILLGLVVPFIGLPILGQIRRTGRVGPPELAALAYFALIGIAFMMVEIEFFHLFALVLGNPTYTLATVLCSLLIFSGVGSLFGKRVASHGRKGVIGLFLALASVLLALLIAKTQLVAGLVGLPFGARIAMTALTIGVLGFFMGLPMPTAMTFVNHRPDILLWGWALNGALSVLASVGAIYMAMHAGITMTFGAGLLCYVAAGILLVSFAGRIRNVQQ